jgi:hypothetical protein
MAVKAMADYTLELLLRIGRAPVAGFPIHASLTVSYRVPRIDEPGTVYPAGLTVVPPLATLAEPPRLGITLVEVAGGRIIASTQPAALPELDERPYTLLLPNEPRRVLIDLARLLPDGLAAGDYGVAVSLEAEGIRATSPMQRLTLAEPGPDGRPRGMPDPGRWDRVIRQLLYGPQPLGAVDLEILYVLDDVYRPEGEAIRIELLAARGMDIDGAIAALREREPGLNWWMDEIVAGTGPIAIQRRILSPGP